MSGRSFSGLRRGALAIGASLVISVIAALRSGDRTPARHGGWHVLAPHELSDAGLAAPARRSAAKVADGPWAERASAAEGA